MLLFQIQDVHVCYGDPRTCTFNCSLTQNFIGMQNGTPVQIFPQNVERFYQEPIFFVIQN